MRNPPSAENESLQADVMRFMAIIAFCLMAILALVKSVDPPPASAANTNPVEAASAANTTPVGAAAANTTPLPQKHLSGSTKQGLILRFASDGDFLRLISRGDVEVFAYRNAEVLALSRDYVFRNARAPKQIYELELGTIPALVSDAFSREHASPDAFTWGVSLPRRIESQIRAYVERVESGVLLIDRFGEVRHVGTS